MKKTTKTLVSYVILGLIGLLFGQCSSTKDIDSIQTINSQVATRWADMSLLIAERTPNNTPTYASRGFGYIGLTMYESVVHGSSSNRSMVGQLNGLVALPKPETGKTYQWELVMNSAQAYILKNIYEHTRSINLAKIDSLEKTIFEEVSPKINSKFGYLENTILADLFDNSKENIAKRSVKYGISIAKAIFEWSKSDGGYQGYKRNFDLDYKIPKAEGTWQVPLWGQSKSALPLHPYWGSNRTFLPDNSNLPIPKLIVYDKKHNSEYYRQMREVFEVNKKLTLKQKETALWWGDDPSFTFTPPGHSYSIANIVVKKSKTDLFKASETFARVGMAVADAFINCWKCKYVYHSERPTTFIRANIDKDWLPFWPEPPFPAFASGHATQGAAMATVMTDLYGNNYQFEDTSHLGRANDPVRNITYKTRSFHSFWEAALESAESRLFGGIHSRQDNEIGLLEGKKIGTHVNLLLWHY